jgi:hypothetical protein
MRVSAIQVIAVATLLTACLPQAVSLPTPENPSPQTTQTNEPEHQVTPAESATLDSAGLDKAAGFTLYRLDATLDYAAHVLTVSELIDYFNNSHDTLTELLLVSASQYDNSTLTYTNLAWSTGAEITNSVVDQDGLHIPLVTPLAPGQRVQINVEYTLALPIGPGTLAWTDRQTNLIDWYPFIPPHISGEGWLVNPPAAVGEHFAYESADFEVTIDLVNAPSLTTIAAPSAGSHDEAGWQFILNNARRFVWSVSNQYETLTANQGDTSISVFFFDEHRDAAEASLTIAQQALETYEEFYGPHPYENLSIVEALFPDGMESDGIFFLDQYYFLTYDYSPRNYLTILTVHEIAHNWWFGQVGNDQANEPWLDEAFATYSELLFYENIYPGHVDWWWQFRVNDHAPTGPVDLRIYETANFREYVNAVYLRGVQFLHDVRGVMGDEAFFAFVRQHLREGAGRIVSAEEFLWRLAYATDVAPLRPIMDEYFRFEDE